MKIRLSLIALALIANTGAFAATAVPAPEKSARPTFESVKACLVNVCAEHNGQKACLREGVHFRAAPTKVAGPDSFSTKLVEPRTGLLQHPVWSSKAGEIAKCLDGLKQ